MSSPVPVFVLRGDFGNVGRGCVLGIFDTSADAHRAAAGCGSFDCGGDGIVTEGWAIRADDGQYYVLDGIDPFQLNVAKPSRARELHGENGAAQIVNWQVVLERSGNNKLSLLKVLRARTGLTLQMCYEMLKQTPTTVGRDLLYSEASRFKRELEESGATVSMKEA